MNVQCVTVGPIGTNCYIVSLEGRNDAVIIDPGAEAENIKKALGNKNAAAVLLTHGHFDHTGALAAFTDAPICIHPADEIMLRDAAWSVGQEVGDTAKRPDATDFVQEGTALHFAGLEISVMHTPGHTLGGVCYRIGDCLFSGDTLFAHGYGRTDFPGGDFAALMGSLRRLLKMPEDLKVYPGHGPATTLSRERSGM